METKLILPPEAEGERADRYLAEALSITRATAQRWLEQGLITVEGRALTKSARLSAYAEISVTPPELQPCEAVPQNIPLNIVYEDDDLLVVNKEKGMVVHPAAGNPDGTLVNALLAHCPQGLSGIGGVLRPGIVHRIDKDTSGLLIVAKNDRAHQGLAEQIKEHSFTREYEAVLVGHLKQSEGTVDAPIGRHPVDRKKMAVTVKNSKPAVTHYRVLEEYPGYSYVRLRLETGRTHQIRVHMAYLGHPVAGDTVYGGAKQPTELQGQCLHARHIGFVHPVSGEWLEFESELPAYFENYLKKLRKTL
ncbi:MAG: RluA family pseudouridine synthase [Clostridia bacterium]|nr:RluA family pseudouridine synthase [Clostridia bacterium]